jgi:hypothetical protein
VYLIGDYEKCIELIDQATQVIPSYSKGDALKHQILRGRNSENEGDITALTERSSKRFKVDVTEQLKPREITLKDVGWHSLLELLSTTYNSNLKTQKAPILINSAVELQIREKEDTSVVIDLSSSSPAQEQKETKQKSLPSQQRQSQRVKEKKVQSESELETEFENFLASLLSQPKQTDEVKEVSIEVETTQPEPREKEKRRKKHPDERKHVLDFVNALEPNLGVVNLIQRVLAFVCSNITYCWSDGFIDLVTSLHYKIRKHSSYVERYWLVLAELHLDLALRGESPTTNLDRLRSLMSDLVQVCHSDLDIVRFSWIKSRYAMVP